MKTKKIIKWPESVMLIRHDVSAYNRLKQLKEKLPLYQKFLAAWKKDPHSPLTVRLAKQFVKKHSLGCGDANTQLADTEGRRAFEVGQALSKGEKPDIVFVSPYVRTLLTYQFIKMGWPALEGVKVIEEERIREQEHGLALLYNDWRIFHTLHPEQAALFKIEGPYWYRYPQGENVPDVRARNRSWTTTLIRDFAGKKVLAVTHHLNILGVRANFERLGADEFLHLDEHDRPINCGVTTYVCDPKQGKNGRLVLKTYNEKLYK